MSAVAGILFFDGAPVEPGLIEKLTGAMKRRGPDEQTHWVQGSVALGHCMLRTTLESLEENQPIFTQGKELVMVWDGRLDNRDELRRELVAAGAFLRDNSDAELAMQSYAIWGDESPKRLLGDFAFAVWDTKQGRLFCARDHMGARPFYYTVNDRFFAFASEEEALPNLPGVSSQPNEERIAYALVPTFQDFDYAHSWLEDVWSLMSAQSMTVLTDRSVQKNTYWQFTSGEQSNYASDEECRDAFLKVFGEAVRCRMRALGNISAMISGGLDSASIAVMVNRLLPEMSGKQFHTYSAISDHPQNCVESQCIQSLTKHLGSNAHFVSVPSFTGILNVQDLIETAWSKPHPVDNSLLLPAMMCLAASRDGHRVMLHGMGGDLTMHVPNLYIAYMLKERQWRHALRECRAATRNNTYLKGTPPVLLLLKNFWRSYMPTEIKLIARRIHQNTAGSSLLHSLINQKFASELGVVGRMQMAVNEATNSLEGIQQTHIRALSPPHGITSGLTGYGSVAGRYGIELRDPWSDRRVVEFFLRLPLKFLVRDGWTKFLVRFAFIHDWAPEVRWRLGREHLGWNFAHVLMNETPGFVSSTLEQDLGLVDRYVDVKAARDLYAEYCTTKGNIEQQSTFDLMTLVLWVKRIRDTF